MSQVKGTYPLEDRDAEDDPEASRLAVVEKNPVVQTAIATSRAFGAAAPMEGSAPATSRPLTRLMAAINLTRTGDEIERGTRV